MCHSLLSVFLPLLSVPLSQLHSDKDRGDGSVKYVLIGEGAGVVFEINETSGDIHAKKRLDREEKAYYVLRAQAVNRRTGQPLEDWSNFTIKIHDINDNEPKFSRDTYLATVPEMSEVGESSLPSPLALTHQGQKNKKYEINTGSWGVAYKQVCNGEHESETKLLSFPQPHSSSLSPYCPIYMEKKPQ